MKRFLVFAGLDYYPGGGVEDFVGAFDEEATAWDACRVLLMRGTYPQGRDWAHVLDTQTARTRQFTSDGALGWESLRSEL